MLKRLLASIAIVSLLLLGVMLVYWWRAHTGHSDHLALGNTGSTQSDFTTARDMNGRAIILIEISENVGGNINKHITPHPFKEFIGYFLLMPGLWLAIKLRSLLPRPGGAQKP